MSAILERHRLTVGDYHKMAEAGILTKVDRLVAGEHTRVDHHHGGKVAPSLLPDAAVELAGWFST